MFRWFLLHFCGGINRFYRCLSFTTFLAHPKVFTVAAIIPMIPGVYAYKAMIAIVQINHYSYSEALLAQALEYFIKTGFILAALVFGLALPGQLFYRRKPVV